MLVWRIPTFEEKKNRNQIQSKESTLMLDVNSCRTFYWVTFGHVCGYFYCTKWYVENLLPGTTYPHSAKGTGVWLDNTEAFPLDEFSCEWV